ncbi:Lrp/AsnC family transcriptional regulator [Xanthomonas citri]|nr:Lrp/AsnC family transcriptional regulator [Xanthomonas citri]MCT8358600.1 Lrp/AsnC family transcriptional regulator [Xanthomonas citri pv. anacardii]MCT8370704.1 Lrp/AsnC family transcriptional regulator [Xanthomonas citri pv. anacardii]MCT8374725.1 Lrp/AsnC family transcriptional regulator [Xanthomonas citri pv. anacardii]MCT8378769.1 Lrp/AsnC family transcriptional regulator [Xanthomonas citri pv. anacardii]
MKKSLKNDRQLDAFDLAILKILQGDNQTPQRVISDQINLSPASVQRRITEMTSAGVILGNTACIDPKAVGQGVTVVVELHLVSDQTNVVNPVKELLKTTPQVQQCYHVTGAAGMILILLVEDLEAYYALAVRLFADNDLVSTFRSLPVLDRVKVGLSVALD